MIFCQANPSVGKDQPPDLAALVPLDATVLSENAEKPSSKQGPLQNHEPVDITSTVVQGNSFL